MRSGFLILKACAKGFKGFVKFIEELLTGAKNGAKAEDLGMSAQEVEEVILQGRKAQSIYNILANARIGFKKLGIEIVAKADGYLLKWKEKPIFKGDFKDVNAFWKKILKPKLGAGTGDLMKYLEIISNDMIRQEHNMSCAAACIRQLAKDNGIEMTEKAIREFARTTEEMGTFPDGIIDAMSKVFRNKNIDIGMKFNPKMSDVEMAKKLSEEGSWIALVLPRNSSVQHTIIVDKIVGNKVYVRDPWSKDANFGKVAVMDINEFEYCWKYAQNWCFRIIKK